MTNASASTSPFAHRSIWRNGEMVPWADASVHLMAQSVQRGTLVFDVMQLFHNDRGVCVLGMSQHLQRFINSARLNDMELAYDEAALAEAVAATAAANPGGNLVKLCAYHDGVTFDILPVERAASVAISVVSYDDLGVRPGWQRRAARLQVAKAPKMPAAVLSPQLKIAASYTHSALAKRVAREAGFSDVLFLDQQGNVAESSTASFFLVADGELRVPGLETVLAGVTRALVIELAANAGLPLREGPVPGALLQTCSEAFLVGSSIHVLEVSQIDARMLPEPVPGPVAQALSQRFDALLSGADAAGAERWLEYLA